jgi:FecR protein
MMLSSNGSRVGESGVSTMRRLCLALAFLPCLTLSGPAFAYAPPVAIEDGGVSSLANATSAAARLAQAQPAPSPAPQPARPAAPPSAAPAPSPATPSSTANAPAQAPAADPIGNVATLTGTATVIRNRNSLPLKLKDDIFLNDVLVTSSNSTLGVTFNDATTFNLTANARITVDNYVYEDNGKNNSALFDIARGTVAFAAASVAKNGDMKITTPSTSLGIRGTTGLVEVEPGATATSANNIKLYPDADGRVGHIDVNDRNGARLGSLTQGSSGFTVRPGAGGRLTATPLAISPQQAARDQGIVRQLHAAQVVGRQVVTEQRALRQANPNRSNPRGAPGQPGGPQRQNNLQQRPGAPQQPGSPNRSGQPGQPNRPGQQGQPPASPNAPGQQGQQQQHPPGAQRQPGARQPANKPAPAIKRPPPPKGKKKKL